MQRKEFFIGIDVSKETLDVAIQGTLHHVRIPNGSEGFKQLQAWFKALFRPAQVSFPAPCIARDSGASGNGAMAYISFYCKYGREIDSLYSKCCIAGTQRRS